MLNCVPKGRSRPRAPKLVGGTTTASGLRIGSVHPVRAVRANLEEWDAKLARIHADIVRRKFEPMGAKGLHRRPRCAV